MALSDTTAPDFAQAYGITQTSFFDDFDTLGTIDLNNTKNPNYKWFVDNSWPNVGGFPNSGWNDILHGPLTPSNILSVNNSILTIAPISTHSARLFTATASGAGFVGNTFGGNGFYAEASIAFTPASATGWISWWGVPIEWLVGQVTKFNELDIFEALPADTGALGTLHEWDVTTSSNVDISDQHGLPTPDSSFHQYGALWVPMSANGGTGHVEWYVDRQPKVHTDYTAGNTYSHSDLLNYIFMLGQSSTTVSMQCDYVAIWKTRPTFQVTI